MSLIARTWEEYRTDILPSLLDLVGPDSVEVLLFVVEAAFYGGASAFIEVCETATHSGISDAVASARIGAARQEVIDHMRAIARKEF